MFKKKQKQNKAREFEKLCRLKQQMKSFFKKEEAIRREMDIAINEKEHKALQKKLDNHLSSFRDLEDRLVEKEEKMIDLDRGLYKGIGINVLDKDYKKVPIYMKFQNFSNHVGYFGTTRIGKTKNMIADSRQLIKKGWDVILIDPKGGEKQELIGETIESCLQANRPEDFKYITPAFPDESEYLNLLFGLSDDEVAALLKIFAESISDDGFFTAVVYQNTLAVVKSLSYIEMATDPTGAYTKELEKEELEKYVKMKSFQNESERYIFDKLNDVAIPNPLTSLERKKRVEKISKKSVLSRSLYTNRSMITFRTLGQYINYEDIQALYVRVNSQIHVPSEKLVGTNIHNKIARLKEDALRALGDVLSTDEMNYAKISKSHSVLITQLTQGNIGTIFSDIGINPLANRILSKDKGLVAVVQPYPMKYPTIADISIMALLKSVENILALIGTSGRGKDRPLAIMIDEAGSVMYKDINSLFNKAGGLGATMFVYSQSYEDYVLKLDKSSAKVIDDNVNTKIIMKMNDPESKKTAAESLGTRTAHKSMFMANSDGGSRFSVGAEDEPIALPEDIGRLGVGMGYLQHQSETYIVDFPYVKGLKNSMIEMPVLEDEARRRELAAYESMITSKREMFN